MTNSHTSYPQVATKRKISPEMLSLRASSIDRPVIYSIPKIELYSSVCSFMKSW